MIPNVAPLVQSRMTTEPPPLIDDPRIKETYADNFVGVTFNNGNVTLTFAVTRGNHSVTPPTNLRQVVERLVLPASIVVEVHAVLGQIIADMESKGIIKKGPIFGLVQ